MSLAIIRYLAFTAVFLALLASHASAGKSSSHEFEEFGRRMVETLSSGDGATFSAALDKEAILQSIFDGVSSNAKTIKDLRAGLSIGLDQAGQLMAGNFGDNTHLKFLKLRHKKSANHALIRIDFRDAGLNYLDLILTKDESGTIKITDWYDYAKGQLYTDSIRQALILLLPEETPFLEKLLSIDKLGGKEAEDFVDLARLMREQKYAEWLNKYDGLSPNLKYSRILLLTRVQVASALDDESQYRLSLKELHNRLGDDPTLSLLLLDYYFYEKDFKAAHEALDNLSEHIGGDAAIDALRANIYLSAEDYTKSMKQAEKAIIQDEEYEDAYWTLLNAGILAEKYDIAVSTLKKLEEIFGYEFAPENFEEEESYAEFVNSDAFVKWKETYLSEKSE